MLSGFKLARYRRVKGLSQSEIAKRLDVTPNYISIMENERQDIPEHIYTKWIDALNGKLVADELQDLEKEVNDAKDTIKNNKKKTTAKK